jgi:hypothetical protein
VVDGQGGRQSVLPFVAALPFLLVGAHLARVARASGALPDRLLSAFFLLLALGVGPRMIAVDLATSGAAGSGGAFWLNIGASLAIGSAMVCLAAFAWKVFRPDSAWAKNLVLGLGAALLGALLAGASSQSASGGSSSAAIAFNFFAAVTLGWAFVECVNYYRRMRRRRALGMADPVVTNRFLLWSLWTGAITLQAILMVGLRVAFHPSGVGNHLDEVGLDASGAWFGAIQGVKAMRVVVAPTVVISVYLSFSPPAGYRRWLRTQQPTPAGC